MLYKTALLEFAAMLKVGAAALQGLTDQETSTTQTERATKLLREVDAIADQLSKLGGGPKDDAA